MPVLEIADIYGGGFGDQFASVKVEDNSTSDDSPRVFNLSFGKDGEYLPVSNFGVHNLEVTPGSVNEANSTLELIPVVSVSPDA